jgi:hypothetical protein
VYLTGLAVYTGYSTSGGTDSNAFTNATDTLDTNSQDLATVLGAAAGKDKQDAFLQVWRAHVDDFVAYAKADAADDAKGRNTALSNLDAYRTSAGKFFADLSDGALNADDVAAALKDHVATLAGAIDSLKVGVLNVPVVIPTSTPTPTDLSVFGGATSSSPSPSESSSESASPSVSATPTASAKSTASITGHSH